MSDQSPLDVEVVQMLDADLAGEGAVGSVKDILCGNADAVAGGLANQLQVERRRRDDNLHGRVELCRVQVLDELPETLASPVPVQSQTIPAAGHRLVEDTGPARFCSPQAGYFGILRYLHLKVPPHKELARHVGRA